ncbi:uncharacterized protein LOC135492087 isoform X3 [Lineus longissimus]
MKTPHHIKESLVVFILWAVVTYILCVYWSRQRPVIVIINESFYIKSGFKHQPRAQSKASEAEPWRHGASTKEEKSVHPFPFFEENVTDCHRSAIGVNKPRGTNGKGVGYGRQWPLMRCSGHTSVTETLCKVLAMQLQECERQQLLQIVDAFQQFAKSKQLVYFMGKKMLLGSWRHHGLIPYERDLTIFVSSKNKMDVIKHFSGLNALKMKNLDTSSLRLSPKSPIRLHNTTYVDILFFEENGTHVFHMSSNDTSYLIKKTLVFPTHMRPFGPFDLSAPKSSAVILFELFGDADMCGSYSAKVPCSDLKGYVAFVFRRVAEFMGPIEERLGWGNLSLQFEFPREDIHSVSVNPFTLKLPKHSN